MAVRIAPAARQQFIDATGNPYAGAKLFTYQAGTTTKQATYTTSVGNVANTNPLILDAAGRTSSGLWLTEGVDYKFVIAPSTDTDPPASPIYTEDGIEGVNDSAAATAGLAASSGSTLLGFIQSGAAAVARTAQAKMRDLVSVKDFGAVGDGVTNDTAAIQAALDYAKSIKGTLTFPNGTYRIESTLTYYNPTPGNGIVIGEGKSHNSGVKLKWHGAAGGVMMICRGINGAAIRGIAFDGNALALRCLDILDGNSPAGIAAGAGAGTYAVDIDGCFFTGTTGANNAGVRVGDSTYQCDTVRFHGCIFAGGYYGAELARGVAAGNCRLISFKDCYFYSCSYAIWSNATGPMPIDNCFFGNSAIVDIHYDMTEGGPILTGCGTEGSKMWCECILNGLPGSLTIIDSYGYFSGTATDDVVIKARNLFISGSSINNTTGAGRPGKIQVAQGGLSTNYSIVSYGNMYHGAVDHIPVWTFDGDYPWNQTSGNYLGKASSLLSIGDQGGTDGAQIHLAMMLGSSPTCLENALTADATAFVGTGFTYSDPTSRTSISKVVIDFSTWKEAALSKDRLVYQLPNRHVLRGVVCETTTAYAGTGLTGTIQMRVGYAPSYNEFILLHDVKTAAVTKGAADADLGTALARATAVQGGLVNFSGAAMDIGVSLLSSVGNLGNGMVTNLTQGSTTLYFMSEKLG